MSSLRSWVLGARPKTLTAAVVPVAVGSSLAFSIPGASRRPELAVFALLSAIAIQVGTNYFNDAIDFKKGTDTAERLGPMRVVQAGLLSARNVMLGGALAFLVAAVLAIPLVLAGGWPIVAIGLFSLAFGYLYTGGPAPLAYVGLGDPFVLVFFGWIAVGGVFYLQTGHLGPEAWIAGTQVGLLATVMIAINNLRDREGDTKTGKRTLAVRFGESFSRLEIATLLLVPYFLGLYWVSLGRPAAFLLPLLSFPIAVRLIRSIYSLKPGAAYNPLLGKAAGVHLLFGVLLAGGMLAWT